MSKSYSSVYLLQCTALYRYSENYFWFVFLKEDITILPSIFPPKNMPEFLGQHLLNATCITFHGFYSPGHKVVWVFLASEWTEVRLCALNFFNLEIEVRHISCSWLWLSLKTPVKNAMVKSLALFKIYPRAVKFSNKKSELKITQIWSKVTQENSDYLEYTEFCK